MAAMQHHAWLITASTLAASGLPTEYLTTSADVVHVHTAQLGIDEVRSLTQQANQRSVTGSGRVFVIVASNLTVQAQNALLKLFEEPPAACQFYLLVPSESVLLPTLRSRLATKAVPLVSGDVLPEVRAFFAAEYKDRLETIAERIKEKDQNWIDGVVSVALTVPTEAVAQRAVVAVAASYRSPGAAKKMLLEELALVLPPRLSL